MKKFIPTVYTHFGVETYTAEKVQKKIKNTRTRYTRETKSEKKKEWGRS